MSRLWKVVLRTLSIFIAIKRCRNPIILCNIFTATVRPILICCCSLSVLLCEDFFPFPTSIVCFKSLPLYTFPKAPSPIIVSREMSSKSTSNGSKSSGLDLNRKSKIFLLLFLLINICCYSFLWSRPQPFKNSLLCLLCFLCCNKFIRHTSDRQVT